MSQTVKSLPAMWETQVRSPGWEKEMATHSSILAWKIPWMEEPGRLQSMGGGGHKESDTTERLHFQTLWPQNSSQNFLFWCCSLVMFPASAKLCVLFLQGKSKSQFSGTLGTLCLHPAPESWRQEPFCALQARYWGGGGSTLLVCWEFVIFWM